jgi:hypothetical protein
MGNIYTILERVRGMASELGDIQEDIARGCPGATPEDMERAAGELALLGSAALFAALKIRETP